MKQKELFIIAVTAFLTIIAWIAADIRHIVTTEKFTEKKIAPIGTLNVQIDEEVFSALREKK